MKFQLLALSVIFTIIMFMGSFCFAQTTKIRRNIIEVISDSCIFDNNNHAAFTSLETWNGNLYLAFREAGDHNPQPQDKGKIVVLKK